MTDKPLPKPGDWVLFRNPSSYYPVRAEMAQAEKVTAKQVRFVGTSHPRQCSLLSVVAHFPDRETAERVRDAIGGVAGEYSKRKLAADLDRTKRLSEALAAANRSIEKIVRNANTGGSTND